MAITDNLMAGAVAAGGVYMGKTIAAGKSDSFNKSMPAVLGVAMAYAIGRYQDANGKMGGIVPTALTGVGAWLGDKMVSSSTKLTSLPKVATAVAAGAGANYAAEKYINI